MTPSFNYKEAKKELQKRVRTLEKQCAELEAQVEKANGELVALNEKLLTLSGSEAAQTAKKIGQIQAEAHAAEARWFELLEEKANLDQQITDLDTPTP
jgi:uncharacterized protein involved in exopolysaccharide biosynthesis